MCGALLAVNAAMWGLAWAQFAGSPALLGLAFLAYTFGLRHAVDADHIAAIDNATRKLVETGRPAATTGLYFSLGHASVVVFASFAIATAATGLPDSLAPATALGAVGTGISALCLFALAAANTLVLVSLCRLFAAARRGEPSDGDELQRLLARRGLLAWLLRGVFRLITRAWHMYPVGFLFGLGFDTATEIGLLGIAAVQAGHGLPLSAVMVFPVLFAAGMALVDSLDAVLMAGAYRWARVQPRRKLYYNLTITLTSIAVAVAVGGIEVLGLIGGDAPSGLWAVIDRLNDNFTAIGFSIVALFGFAWLASLAVSRWRSAPTG